MIIHLSLMVANAFGVLGSYRKCYNAMFPPDSHYSGNPSPSPQPGTTVVTVGDSASLTKSWRIVESGNSSDAYLSVEYYEAKGDVWVPVHTFNTSV